MVKIYETDVEKWVVEEVEARGYTYLSPDEQEAERPDLREVVLAGRLRAAVEKLNPNVSADAREDAVKQVLNLDHQHLLGSNEAFQKMLTDGVGVLVQTEDGQRGEVVRLIDFENPRNNDLVVANQFTVPFEHSSKRPDVVIIVNGLPLVVIELKNPTDENATVLKAYTQLQNYKDAIPQLFTYNGVLVASDGIDAKMGSLTAEWERFSVWRAPEEKRGKEATTPQMDTIIEEMLVPEALLDLIRYFTVFEKNKKEDPKTKQITIETVKKTAAYHQYYLVNKAVQATMRATAEHGDRKIGVAWHTQGSGKSLSMVFYSAKVVLALDNPTVVVITDRNDLDDQLFDTFAASRSLLRQEPVQAESRTHLKELLRTAGGGIVFTTIQKFFPADGGEMQDLLSDRKNIVVIADEAHRSQYGFAARTVYKEEEEAITRYGNAKYLRDALPNASFIGFTGTPLEKEDRSTPAVFGNYLDIYDIQRAVEDGATKPIYYESRLVKVHLPDDKKSEVDADVEAVAEGVEFTAKEKAKAKWAQLEAIVGNRERLKEIARDIVAHFEARQEVFVGKGMIVAMSRRIAVELYEEIVALRPAWHNRSLDQGQIKVVMTANSSDPREFQPHHTNKEMRRKLADHFKDAGNELKLVIVCDMWLTGFDVPCLHTMYIDKLMRGHNLMQAIARVNRVFRDKPGGLIVDYIGFASDLQKALADYTQSGGKGDPTITQEKAIEVMLEKYEVVRGMFHGFEYRRFFAADTKAKLGIILEAQEHILGLDKGAEEGTSGKEKKKPVSAKERYIKGVILLSQAFAIAVPSDEALSIRDEVAFFQAVKARLVKFEPDTGVRKSDIDTAIRQIVDQAIVAEGVIDIFAAAGVQKPDLSVLSDEFLSEVQGLKHPNVAMELLKKVIADEVRLRLRRNLITGKKLSEMLDKTIKKYQNNLLTASEVIQELIALAKQIREEDARGTDLGLSNDEIAFYDALADNESAREVLGDDKLRDLARVLVEKVRGSTTIDWTIRESVQARLRVLVKRTLAKYGYPPDKQAIATEFVLKQAELFADDWAKV
jgi:type I restriction enzyme, R subunit